MKRPINLVLISAFALLMSCNSAPKATETEVPTEPVETFTIVEGHAPVWEQAIAQIKELGDAMPENLYSYRPHDSVRTFAEQLVHIGGSSKVIANMFLMDVQPSAPPEMDISAMSKDEVMTMVTTSLTETWDIMEGMSDQKLQEGIKSFSGNDMTRLEGMLLVHDHLSNHKGKANLYVRMSGNKPPSYRYY